ncbi:MAG: DUF1826 domain-containing protein [Rhizobiaceae bacterium]|nr:DUF1826 domain-containing protein [Rhizobiaceae bacterium]
MNYIGKNVENAVIGVAVSDEPGKFDILRQPGVAATIWRRKLPSDFQEWMDTLPVEILPSARVIIREEIARDAVEVICQSAGLPNTMQRHYFVQDVVSLAKQFSELMGTRNLRLRFDVIDDNACRKFHIDAVTARLVCTYRGIGTQYGMSSDGEEPKRIFSTPTGSPIVLRGTEWPELPASGLLHRSPPVEGTGMTRLVLVIDALPDEDEPTKH